MEETRTRFCEAIPASRKASSNDVSPPCVCLRLGEESFFGTMLFPNSYVSSVSVKIVVPAERSRHESTASERVGTGFARNFIEP